MRLLSGLFAVYLLAGAPEGTTSWTERFDGGYCFASAEAFFDRCEVEVVQRDQGSDATGQTQVRCGDRMEACGQKYRCVCDPDAKPNPAWQINRQVSRVRRDAGVDELTVNFQGGACRVLLTASTTCLLSGSQAWTEGELQRERIFKRSLRCGKSVELCGERVQCACAGKARTLHTPGVALKGADGGS